MPGPDDAEPLLGTAILMALHQQTDGKAYLAVGEKTPENVFLFPRLKRLFPTAKFIGVARAPDVLTSAWHFFHKQVLGEDENEAKAAFISSASAQVGAGARAMIALTERYSGDWMIVTHEVLGHRPTLAVADLFQASGHVRSRRDRQRLSRADCVRDPDRRPRHRAGSAGSVFCRGAIGGRESTLTPEINQTILRELG